MTTSADRAPTGSCFHTIFCGTCQSEHSYVCICRTPASVGERKGILELQEKDGQFYCRASRDIAWTVDVLPSTTVDTMRLLERTSSGEICATDDFLDHKAHAYAILSHTWGPEEVGFQSFVDGTGKTKLGYHKIQFCGDQAWHHGLRFFWIDTCCINKADNTELQEAINCMFRWYQNAARCYVYLDDVSTPTLEAADKYSWEPAFRKSRWFTRGWTLQELIAPVSVEFFSKEGVCIGDRDSLEQEIHEITRIPIEILRGSSGSSLLPSLSVPERFSWMEKRQTLRKEDKAYSLLGIFDVHMPLIYGEGEKNAFRRLREEIDKAAKRRPAGGATTGRTHRCKLGQVMAFKVDAALQQDAPAFRRDLDILLGKITSLSDHWNDTQFRHLIELFSAQYSLGMSWDDTSGTGFEEGLAMWSDQNLPMSRRLQGGYARLFIYQNSGNHAFKILWVQTLLAIHLYVGGD